MQHNNATATVHQHGAPAALAVGALLVNAFVWGVSWWPFRQLESQGLHAMWATALVYAVAVACVPSWAVVLTPYRRSRAASRAGKT